MREYWEETARQALTMLKGNARSSDRVAEAIGYLQARVDTHDAMQKHQLGWVRIIPGDKAEKQQQQ